jgi:hypothetical protein
VLPGKWYGTLVFGTTRLTSTPRADSRSAAESVHFHVPATAFGEALLPQDGFLLRLITQNRWRRPIYFTEAPPWLSRHTRVEGLVTRLVPADSAATDCALLRRNLMERYAYTGFPTDVKSQNWMTAGAEQMYVHGFLALIACERERQDTTGAALASMRLKTRFPNSPGDQALTIAVADRFRRIETLLRVAEAGGNSMHPHGSALALEQRLAGAYISRIPVPGHLAYSSVP